MTTPLTTLIAKNKRYAGSQIRVAAMIAAATMRAAVPRIGIVMLTAYSRVKGSRSQVCEQII